ncbi:CG3165, partial [Drosophila busckii]
EMENATVADNNVGQSAKISTIAVLDLECSNFPSENNNRVSITELCIYAFDSSILKDNGHLEVPELDDFVAPLTSKLPTTPRVLHKLNLLFRPSMLIWPDAERITGLSNFLLERESRLDENAAQMIINFLKHLPAPVCLVAHNGWGFDFPIVKQAFDKIGMQLPDSVLCVDSLRAFLEIDDKRKLTLSNTKVALEVELNDNTEQLLCKPIDWQTLNETTPKRPTLPREEAYLKRKQLADGDYDTSDETPSKRTSSTRELRSRRQLFSGLKCAQTKRYPPKGLYQLGNLFSSKFSQPASNAHQAEADVVMLTKLIQHYGVDFLAFAEEQNIPFAEIIPVG